jgi:hypothetical protein
LRSKLILFFILAFILLFFDNIIYAQKTLSKDSIIQFNDSLSLSKKKTNKTEPIKSKIKYNAKDSILFDMIDKKVFLYGSAEIYYEKIVLKASYIEINFEDNSVFATYTTDSTGKKIGIPEFSENDQKFNASAITYNFKTKKGIIKEVITQESGGYLHGNRIKRTPNAAIHIANGAFTTCDLEHPHFQIRFSKAKIIPNDKIITGPAYLEIEDIPIPLGLPFGYFPSRTRQKSGLIFPAFGEDAKKGFNVTKLGYYFGFSDYIDLAVTSDLYTRGSFKFDANSNYALRYKFNGNINLSYAKTIFGEELQPDYKISKDFFIRWSHNQDPKARPNSRFSANVNFGTSKYNSLNSNNTADYLANTYQSNISYSQSIGNNMNLVLGLRHNQNTNTKIINITIPEIAFSVNKFYPFRKKERIGNLAWYENIGVTYSMNSRNEVTTYDSLFSWNIIKNNIRNGIMHSIPISYSIPVMKFFNLSSTINYSEKWYSQSIKKTWIDTSQTGGYTKTDINHGFQTAREITFQSTLNTKLFGIMQFKKGKIKAIRHVITPAISFSYNPGFPNYYKSITDNKGQQQTYSIFENSIYGTPTANKSGIVNLSISNNLEMKVRSKNDSIGYKKIVILDNLTFATNYDMFKDSLNFSDITMAGRTKLLNKIDLVFAGAWSPYAMDKNGNTYNQTYWQLTHNPLRIKNTNWTFSFNYNIKPSNKKNKNLNKQKEDIYSSEDKNFAPFHIPYNLNVFLNFQYNKTWDIKPAENIIKTLGFNGDIPLTSKWRIGFTSGYDFNNKDFSYTTVNIYRDLHCWEMRFDWVPFGQRQRYEFVIRVKASMLQDLKLTRKKEWWEYK